MEGSFLDPGMPGGTLPGHPTQAVLVQPRVTMAIVKGEGSFRAPPQVVGMGALGGL